ncbi:MAG: flagellar hook protein FlgE [Pseudomonadota bacterium]
MLDALFISVTGMSAFSTQIGVASNNISNLETTGYKSNTASFEDVLTQSLSRVSSSNSGSGVNVQSISENWTQGSITDASSTTNLAIDGEGLFVVQDSDSGLSYYTRDGSFGFDTDGRLIYDDDYVVQGYALDANGNLGALTDIDLSYENSPPAATTSISTTVNLNSSAETDDYYSSTVEAYDSLGNTVPLTITYTKTENANEWTWTAEIAEEYGSVSGGASGTLTFDSNGILTSGADPVIELSLTNGAADQDITWDLYSDSGTTNGSITQYSGSSLMTDSSQDGYPAGELTSVEIDESGNVVCSYSNEAVSTPYRIALADFNNLNGLNKVNGNLYSATTDSGEAILGTSDAGRLGSISPSSLESSNVDLSSEMAEIILSQTAYQACAKSFSAANELLEVLINMK